jgi:branched-chain amino acid transport system substrate-binding protein
MKLSPGRRFAALAAVALLATVVSACSSSSKGSSATTSGGSSATTSSGGSATTSGGSATTSGGSSATGSTLSLGAISDETGACIPQATQDQSNTLSAWASYVNSHGGVAGHPVKVTVIDTKCNPADAAAAAQTLISSHVLAIIDGTGLDAAFAKSVDAAKIPVLCGIQNGNGFTCQSDANFFPSGTTVIAGIYGQSLAAKQAGGTSYGIIYCAEVAACKTALPLQQGFTKAVNMTWVPPLAASFTAPNYTAQCVTMHQVKADALFEELPLPKFAADCAQQGYKPIWVASMGTWETSFLKDSNLNGMTGDTADIPWTYQGPPTATFQAAEASVLSSTNNPYIVSTTYAGALLFQTALANAGASPTTQDVYTGLYAMHNETLGGYSPPLTFTQGKPTTVDCLFTVQIKNGAFISPNGATPQCQPVSGTSST